MRVVISAVGGASLVRGPMEGTTRSDHDHNSARDILNGGIRGG